MFTKVFFRYECPARLIVNGTQGLFYSDERYNTLSMKNIEHIAFGVHMVALTFALLNIIVADWKGIAWIRGMVPTLPRKTMRHLHNHIWLGLGLLVFSGAVLFCYHQTVLLVSFAFYAKIACVSMVSVNGIFINRHMQVASEQSFASLPKARQRALVMSGIVSCVGWFGALALAGFLLPE